MFEIEDINGAKFIFSPLDAIETASLGIFFRVGSRYEQAGLKGIAHLLEHMVFKGSKRYSHLQIKREIEGRGGTINAFTSHEITGYYIHTLAKNLYSNLSIILDMVYQPLLKANDILKEKNVILEEIKMHNDLPSSRAAAVVDSLLWPQHPLGEEVIGRVETVRAIQRSDLVQFGQRYYLPKYMVVSFSGRGSRQKIAKALAEYTAGYGKVHALSSPVPDELRAVAIATEKKNFQQTHLCVGFRSFPYASPYRIPLQLLNIILGANMSSRLFEELREKKSLCYDISTQIQRYKDSGAFVIHAGLDKTMVVEALKTIIRVLDTIKGKQVCLSELLRAKDYLLGQIVMALEHSQSRMFYFAEQYLALNEIQALDIIKKEIAQVTPQVIQKVACDIFNFGVMRVACVGNIDDGLECNLRQLISS